MGGDQGSPGFDSSLQGFGEAALQVTMVTVCGL